MFNTETFFGEIHVIENLSAKSVPVMVRITITGKHTLQAFRCDE